MIVVPVLMAGGSGTRLWPLSREMYPKQFLRLVDEHSLLQAAAMRTRLIPSAEAPIVVGNERHRFLIAEQMRQIGLEGATILLEPEGRNTAPVAGVAAHYVAEKYGPDALVFLTAADQTLTDAQSFLASIEIAVKTASRGELVTFGIRPTSPATGFGYVRVGSALPEVPGAYRVTGFFEKPSAENAERYFRDQQYFWNGGMFLFPAAAFLREFQCLEPEMHASTRAAVTGALRDLDFLRLDSAAFRACRSDSIDYAVMEKAQNLAVVPLDAGWDDLGSWGYLAKRQAVDEFGNHTVGDVVLEDARNNLVYASARLVTLLGVADHIVVETGDAVLVTRRECAQDIAKLLRKLKAARRPEVTTFPQVYRPWGHYETIASGERYQVKRLVVKPGHKLSLQMHHHRAEHWVIVTGTALVTCGDEQFLLTEDQSTYIPLGTVHRVENPGKVALEIIEVQTGAYLGEDDITRLDDEYGRTALR